MRKRVSIILIIVGVCVFMTPFVGSMYVKYEQEQIYAQYLKELEKQNEKIEIALSEDVEEVKEETTDFALDKVKGTIGIIEIPKIDCKQLVIEGSDSYALRYGIGHVSGTAFPGEVGNVALAGHRNGTFGSYFSRIGEMEKGDYIICDYKGYQYYYKVTEVFIVEPTKISVLEGRTNQRIMTLISCHPRGRSTHRIIVRAELVV
ncbi:MAG: class D sortase [Eubacteriales bacterium]